MGKRIFWLFLLSVAVVTTVAVIYIQSEPFARIVRRHLQNKVAKSLGVELNFERLKIGVLPPSLSLTNVDLKVGSSDNKLGLGTDTVFRAASLGFSFRMIQAFSSGIEVNKVFLSDAVVRLAVPKGNDDGAEEKFSDIVHRPIKFQISERFFATIRQLEMRHTELDISWRAGGQISRAFARDVSYLALTPSVEGTDVVVNAEDVDIRTPKVNERIKAIKANVDFFRGLVLIANLDVQRREAALHASGKLVGSIDNITDLRSDVDIILRGPARELSDFEKKLGEFGGEITADVKIVGKLKDPSLQGKVEVAKFSHELWELEKIELSGSYGGGTLVVDTFSVLAGGGRAFLKNKMEVQFPFKPEAAVFQLKLEGAKFEDFAGNLRKSVNNLRMKLDGNVQTRLDFSESGGKVKVSSVSLRPEVTVTDLELNNQIFKKKDRPYRRIFKVAPFRLVGNVQIKNGDLLVKDTKFHFASGSMDVSGSHTESGGYEILGTTASINVGTEVGEISGIPIKGEGALGLRVHGPDDAVLIDFDIKQQNANFVQFDFGKLEGKIVYDDKNNHILIPGVKGQHGTASYAVNGKVDLGESESIALETSFEESAPDDLFAIFAHQLAHISWIPHGMTGTVKGKAKVGGKYSDGLNSLEIDSQAQGKNLSYKGEIFHEVSAHAGVTKGMAFAHDVQAKKYDTPFTGKIDYDLHKEEMRYVLNAERGKLRSLDFLSLMEAPIDGMYSLHSEGHGRWETLNSKSRFDVSNGFMRTRPLPPIAITYDTAGGGASYSVKLGPSAALTGEVSRGPRDESYAQFSLQRTNFDFLLCWLSRSSCGDPSLALNLSADARFTWRGWNWEAMNGGGSLQELQLSKTAYNLRLNSPVRITATNGVLESGSGTLEGEDSRIGFHLRGRADGTGLDNSVRGSVSLKVLEFLTPLILESRGKMKLDMTVGGNVRNAAFHGNIGISEGMLRLSGLEAPVENLEGGLRMADSRLTIDRLTGQLGGGSVQASGWVDLFLNKPPKFAVDLFCADNRIKFFPVNYAEISDAKLSFKGDAPPYLFSGTARFKRLMMRNNFDLGRGKGLQNAKYLPEKVAGVKSFYEVRLRGLADGGIFVDNNLLNAEFSGEVTLMNNFEFPQIVGRASLVRGKLLFRNTAFTLDQAYIRAPNPEVFNPMFSISGVANLDVYRINIYAAGTVDRPKISLSSYPALPQEDIVSLLAFGYRGEDARKINPNDTSAITYSEVGSILLEQLQLSQNLQSKGLKVMVAPAFADTEASIVRPNTAATAAPKVYVQSQVMKNLEAVLGGTVGAAQGQSMDAKMEYHLNRRASVRGVYEQSPSGLDTKETKNSYGADLRFRWEFK